MNSQKIRVADIVNDSIVDGPGLRFVLFAQGCKRHCPGCHNPKTHSLKSGFLMPINRIISLIAQNKLITGVTFSGGEPFLQSKNFSILAEKLHNLSYDIMCYTGYIYEDLLPGGKFYTDDNYNLLKNIDTLVDGPFEIDKFSLTLKFKGSSNQRIIDVKESLKINKTVVIG